MTIVQAQGKPFPDEPIFVPAVSPVPPHISQDIQRHERHAQLVPVIVDPFRAHVDIQAQQAKQHMAGQQGGSHSAGHAGQAEAVARRLHPYPYPYPHPPAPGIAISGSAARGPYDPLAAQADLLAAELAAAAAAEAYETLSVEDGSDSLAHGDPSAAAAVAVASHSFYTAVPKPKPLGLPDKSPHPYSVVPKRPDAPNARQPLHGSLTPQPPAALSGASHSFYTAEPKPKVLDVVDVSPYPYSVIPKRLPATEAKQQGPAADSPFGSPAHGTYASADSESLIDSHSMPASESLTGSTSHCLSESLPSELYPASECSSLMTHSSSESFVRSEDSAPYADTLDSTSADSDMRSDAELRHDMSFNFDTASVAESGGSRWRHIHHT